MRKRASRKESIIRHSHRERKQYDEMIIIEMSSHQTSTKRHAQEALAQVMNDDIFITIVHYRRQMSCHRRRTQLKTQYFTRN